MMDAVTYITNMRRMCKSQGDTCRGCKLSNEDEEPCYLNKTAPEYCVTVVERWAAEHPVKTRMSVFLEQWPDARIHGADGLPFVSPCYLVDKPDLKCTGVACPECRKDFWLAEVEE